MDSVGVLCIDAMQATSTEERIAKEVVVEVVVDQLAQLAREMCRTWRHVAGLSVDGAFRHAKDRGTDAT